MKKLFQILLPLMISSQLFAIAGFGLNLDQSIFNVTTYSDSLIDNTNQKAAKLNLSFKNGYGVGGYFYIDVLPIDIDLEAKALLGNYDLSFINSAYSISETGILPIAFSGYITLNKKLFKLSIPVLAKAKLSAGAGANFSSSIPTPDQTMIDKIMGGRENMSSGSFSYKNLIDELKNNRESKTGFHIQTGIQFKLLTLDSFLYYRHIFANNVIPGGKGFGSLNLRLGMGF
jgi:hypothetical protein